MWFNQSSIFPNLILHTISAIPFIEAPKNTNKLYKLFSFLQLIQFEYNLALTVY